MMTRSLVRSILLGAVVAVPAAAAAQNPPAGAPAAPGAPRAAPLPPHGWRVDPNHSAVNFRVRHLGISWVNGEFRAWTADVVYDPADPAAASVTARIQTASVNSNNERRDNDIRSGNYLAVDSFPEMVFVSRRVEPVDATHLRVAGDLTLRGVTRPVVLDAEITGSLDGQRVRRMAFTATTTIRRQDFGVVFNGMIEGAQVVGDDIHVTIDIEAMQPTPSS